jgi:WD40 repeat protein
MPNVRRAAAKAIGSRPAALPSPELPKQARSFAATKRTRLLAVYGQYVRDERTDGTVLGEDVLVHIGSTNGGGRDTFVWSRDGSMRIATGFRTKDGEGPHFPDAVGPNGLAAASCAVRSLTIWSDRGHKRLHELDIGEVFGPGRYGYGDMCMAFTLDGLLVIGLDLPTVAVLDPVKGTVVQRLEGHTVGEYEFVRVGPAAGGGTVTLDSRAYRIWSPQKKKAEKTIPIDDADGHDLPIFAPDGERMLVTHTTRNARGRDTISVRDATTWKLLKELLSVRKGVYVRSPAFVPEANMIVGAATDGRLRLWNAQTLEAEDVIDISRSKDDIVCLVALSGTKQFLAFGERAVFYRFEIL